MHCLVILFSSLRFIRSDPIISFVIANLYFFHFIKQNYWGIEEIGRGCLREVLSDHHGKIANKELDSTKEICESIKELHHHSRRRTFSGLVGGIPLFCQTKRLIQWRLGRRKARNFIAVRNRKWIWTRTQNELQL